MPKTVPIEVFNIAHTQVDEQEIQRWLTFLNAHEFSVEQLEEMCTSPAALIALAGKRCYMSFEAGLNPNVTKIRSDYVEYFDNILKSGHGSVTEHATRSFAIENVSRVFTAEMNRHRAGWAISEGSLRFIRFGECIPYWEPTSITGPDVASDHRLIDSMIGGIGEEVEKLAEYGSANELILAVARSHGLKDQWANMPLDMKKQLSRAAFKLAFSSQEYYYRILETIWADELAPTSKFAGKKNVTSMMRRIVGLGVATGGVWTGNMRALRHVFTMRAAPEAEEEMLHVFSRVAKTMAEKEPMLFGDFTFTDEGYAIPKYRKV